MTDIYNDWNKLTETKFNRALNTSIIMESIKKDSSSTMAELKKRLKGKMAWIVFFIIGDLLWMAISHDRFELLLIQIFILIEFFVSLYFIGQQYRKMDSDISFANSTLRHLKSFYKSIRKALHIEMTFGLITMPISGILGMLISKQYNGESFVESFQDHRFLIAALVFAVIAGPLLYWLAAKANDYSFGKQIKNLEKYIAQYELLESDS